MSRQLLAASTLDNLKKEAKRWLKALRAGDDAARARFRRAHPDAPADPGLRDVQHALAREHGLPGWSVLKNALAARTLAQEPRAEHLEWFLENACPDHHVRGGPDHVMARHTAMQILSRHPEIAHASLDAAVVCGELEEVNRILAARPQAASEKSSTAGPERDGPGGSGDRFRRDLGPKGWEPLLYLCFARLPLAATNDNAVAIARALLDRGADPNAGFMAGNSRYTPLVGVIGEGEEGRPPHPQREALTRLLLERGAEPYDSQVIYNIGFHGNVRWFLELIHEETVKRGRAADWDDPSWPMLDMGGYGSGARWHLEIAVDRNDLALAEWLLAHGASANAAPAPHKRRPQGTLYEEAMRRGFTDMAELLLRHGAAPTDFARDGVEAFHAACLRCDRAAAQALLDVHPEYRAAPDVMMHAARHDQMEVVTFLLDLGLSANLEDPRNGRQRPLHVAGSPRVAARLLERGAEIDYREASFGATALGFAVYGQNAPMIEILSRHSRDVWDLVFTGNLERLRAVLKDEPQRARASGDGQTPLMWLPGDDARAVEIVVLLLACGADPTIRNEDGLTAADLAGKRGLDAAARRLSAAAINRPG